MKKRARRLDRTFSCCGVQFGWTFIIGAQTHHNPFSLSSATVLHIGLVPVVGDGVNIALNYVLVVKKAEQAEYVPSSCLEFYHREVPYLWIEFLVG